MRRRTAGSYGGTLRLATRPPVTGLALAEVLDLLVN